MMSRSFLCGIMDVDEKNLENAGAVIAKVGLKYEQGLWTHIMADNVEFACPKNFECGCHDVLINMKYLYGLQLGVNYKRQKIVPIAEIEPTTKSRCPNQFQKMKRLNSSVDRYFRRWILNHAPVASSRFVHWDPRRNKRGFRSCSDWFKKSR